MYVVKEFIVVGDFEDLVDGDVVRVDVVDFCGDDVVFWLYVGL